MTTFDTEVAVGRNEDGSVIYVRDLTDEINRLRSENGRMRHCLEVIASRDGLPAEDHETVSLRSQEISMQVLDTLT